MDHCEIFPNTNKYFPATAGKTEEKSLTMSITNQKNTQFNSTCWFLRRTKPPKSLRYRSAPILYLRWNSRNHLCIIFFFFAKHPLRLQDCQTAVRVMCSEYQTLGMCSKRWLEKTAITLRGDYIQVVTFPLGRGWPGEQGMANQHEK